MLKAKEIEFAKEGMHADGGGLYLRVQASGAKSWIFRYQLNGKRREMGIGTLIEKPVVSARAEAAQLAVTVKTGVDPIEARRRCAEQALAVERAAEAGVATFRKVADDYIAANRSAWRNPKHAEQWVNTLEAYAHPVIGEKPVGDVSTDDVLAILQPIWTTKTETASRLRGRVEAILSRAKALKLRQGENPAAWRGHLDALLPAPLKVMKRRHHPALPYERMPEFMAALRAAGGTGARALEFAILTAARSGEVRLAKWSEFDRSKQLWTVPADRMKAGREHRVPLSSAVLALLDELPRIEGVDYLFPGGRDERPISDMTLTAVIRRMNDAGANWIDPKNGGLIVPHGFRSTFRDWAADATHYANAVAEMALAHTVSDKVEAAYRRGDMLDRRREMMEAWAAWCGPKPSNAAA